MIEKIQKYLTVLDLPSGVVMGAYTLVIIGMSIASFVKQHPIDASVIEAYKAVATLFAGSKVAKSYIEGNQK